MYFYSVLKISKLFILCFFLSCCVIFLAFGGDEDKIEEKIKPAPVEVAPPPVQEAPEESPAVSLEPEEMGPTFQEEKKAPAPVKKAASKPKSAFVDPDTNIDYSELVEDVEPEPNLKGVLPPALGFRGYRPNMLALGYGDRTPGVGAMVEYSWNRIGLGIFGSYRRLSVVDGVSTSQIFSGVYGLYRWLPWSFSPYFSIGLEAGDKTNLSYGPTAGFGMEVQIYQEFTLLVGYTYHSIVRNGFLGGALGWSF